MSNTNRTKSLVKDTFLFGISSFGSKILVFLLTPLYTNILDTADFGIADLIQTTINFIYPILTLAISEATLRFVMDAENDKRATLSNALMVISVSALFLSAFTPFVKYINSDVGEYWLFFLAIYYLFNVTNCLSFYLKGIGKTRTFAIAGIFHTFIILVSNILLLVILKMGIRGYLLSQVIGHLLTISYMVFREKIYLDISTSSISPLLLRKMVRYSAPIVPTLAAWSLNISIDKYMLIWLSGLSTSGIYSVAHRIPSMLSTVLTIFVQAWQLSAIKTYGDKDEGEYYARVYKGLLTVSIVICFVLLFTNKFVASILFKKQFYVAWQYAPMLLVAAMYSCLSGFLAAPFRASMKTGGLFHSQLVGLGVNVVLNYVLIIRYGAKGAAIATAVCSLIVWIIRLIGALRLVKMKLNFVVEAVNHILLFTCAFAVMIDVVHVRLLLAFGLMLFLVVNAATVNEMLGFLKKCYARSCGRRA